MIVLTRLNDSQFAVNPDLIERILANPDTTLVMVDGAKYIVTEAMDEVIDLITRYRAQIIRMARGVPPLQTAEMPPLGLVPALAEETPATTIPLRPRNI